MLLRLTRGKYRTCFLEVYKVFSPIHLSCLLSYVSVLVHFLLNGVVHGCDVPPEINLYFSSPSFHALFIETVVLRYCWNNTFVTIRTCRTLGQVSRSQVPHCRTHYGENVRQCYAALVFNNLPKSCFNVNTKRNLQRVLKNIMH